MSINDEELKVLRADIRTIIERTRNAGLYNTGRLLRKASDHASFEKRLIDQHMQGRWAASGPNKKRLRK